MVRRRSDGFKFAGGFAPRPPGSKVVKDQGVRGVYRRRTVPVDELMASNAWGLRHMHGNVWEWVEDHWHATYGGAPTDGRAWLSEKGSPSPRVLRGGSWLSGPWSLRSANRYWDGPEFRVLTIGFRVARTPLTP
ncbi:MAG: formylglycine-generating enzyme family protein [Pseudomonadota bacterium]